jgi:hypothetical protein
LVYHCFGVGWVFDGELVYSDGAFRYHGLRAFLLLIKEGWGDFDERGVKGVV